MCFWQCDLCGKPILVWDNIFRCDRSDEYLCGLKVCYPVRLRMWLCEYTGIWGKSWLIYVFGLDIRCNWRYWAFFWNAIVEKRKEKRREHVLRSSLVVDYVNDSMDWLLLQGVFGLSNMQCYDFALDGICDWYQCF